MDTMSIAEAAESLNTSVPRVERAIHRAGIGPLRGARGRRLSADQVGHLREILGFAPAVEGFTRHELLVLAALNARPLGLRSARAVARAASISPTSASTALDRLISRGLVARTPHRLIEGTVRDVDVYEIDRGAPQWRRIAPLVRQVVTPAPPDRNTRPGRVPTRLWHHFWNANPATINVPTHERYVAARLLRSGDPQAVAWGASNLSSDAISSTAELRGVNEPERQLLTRLAETAGQVRMTGFDEDARNGASVASVEDIVAMKLKVILDRGELRDYYDLMEIDRRGHVRAEEGIALFMLRYGIVDDDQRVTMVIRSLGYLDDVADDPGLPVERSVIEAYWAQRQPDLVRSLGRY